MPRDKESANSVPDEQKKHSCQGDRKGAPQRLGQAH